MSSLLILTFHRSPTSPLLKLRSGVIRTDIPNAAEKSPDRGKGDLCRTNIVGVALQRLEHSLDIPVTSDVLETLPQTLRMFHGYFNPLSLKERFRERFPLSFLHLRF